MLVYWTVWLWPYILLCHHNVTCYTPKEFSHQIPHQLMIHRKTSVSVHQRISIPQTHGKFRNNLNLVAKKKTAKFLATNSRNQKKLPNKTPPPQKKNRQRKPHDRDQRKHHSHNEWNWGSLARSKVTQRSFTFGKFPKNCGVSDWKSE